MGPEGVCFSAGATTYDLDFKNKTAGNLSVGYDTEFNIGTETRIGCHSYYSSAITKGGSVGVGNTLSAQGYLGYRGLVYHQKSSDSYLYGDCRIGAAAEAGLTPKIFGGPECAKQDARKIYSKTYAEAGLNYTYDDFNTELRLNLGIQGGYKWDGTFSKDRGQHDDGLSLKDCFETDKKGWYCSPEVRLDLVFPYARGLGIFAEASIYDFVNKQLLPEAKVGLTYRLGY